MILCWAASWAACGPWPPGWTPLLHRELIFEPQTGYHCSEYAGHSPYSVLMIYFVSVSSTGGYGLFFLLFLVPNCFTHPFCTQLYCLFMSSESFMLSSLIRSSLKIKPSHESCRALVETTLHTCTIFQTCGDVSNQASV